LLGCPRDLEPEGLDSVGELVPLIRDERFDESVGWYSQTFSGALDRAPAVEGEAGEVQLRGWAVERLGTMNHRIRPRNQQVATHILPKNAHAFFDPMTGGVGITEAIEARKGLDKRRAHHNRLGGRPERLEKLNSLIRDRPMKKSNSALVIEFERRKDGDQ
jgi:hypothetical protein